MNFYGLAVSLVLVAAMSVLGGFRLGQDHERANQLEAVQKAEQERDEAQAFADQRSTGFEQVVTYLNGQVRKNSKGWRDALDNPVYRECKPDAVGLRLLNDFIDTANGSRKPAGSVSTGGADARGRDDGRLDAGIH